MKKIIALSVAATLAGTVAGVAQDAAGQQLSPTISTQADPGTTAPAVINPTTGTVVAGGTVPAVVPPIVVAGSVAGIVVGVAVIDSLSDDDDGGSGTGTTGTN